MDSPFPNTLAKSRALPFPTNVFFGSPSKGCRMNKRMAWMAGAITTLCLLRLVYDEVRDDPYRSPNVPLKNGTYAVARILGPHHLWLLPTDTSQQRPISMKLLGVNLGTAGKQHREQATACTSRFLLQSDGIVRVQLDRQRFDDEGHCLGYVFPLHSQVSLNEHLVSEGYGDAAYLPGMSSHMHRKLLAARNLRYEKNSPRRTPSGRAVTETANLIEQSILHC